MSKNRLWNITNPHQGDAVKALCLCSAGLLRSPTLAWILGNEPYNFNTRAAGLTKDFALIYADDVLLRWADKIFVMDGEMQGEVVARCEDIGIDYSVHNMDVPDIYARRDEGLVNLMNDRLKEFGIGALKELGTNGS